MNLSDVVLTPDFQTALKVIRGVVKVGTNGVGVRTNEYYDIFGIVNPLDSFELERLPEAEQLKGGVEITSTFALSAGQNEQTADIVEVQTVAYTVVSVDNCSMYGYYIAKCKLVSTRANINDTV